MAYDDKNKLQVIGKVGVNEYGSTWFVYQTSDNRATVIADGYFDEILEKEKLEIKSGDMIHCEAAEFLLLRVKTVDSSQAKKVIVEDRTPPVISP